LYLRGRHACYKRTEDGMRDSIEFFEKAIRHDASYAPAYHGVSDAHTMLACRGIVPAADAFHKAKTAARQPLQIDPELGEGYASLAHVRLHDWDWVGLEENFTRSLECNPVHAITHYWYAEYLMAMHAYSHTRQFPGIICVIPTLTSWRERSHVAGLDP
jgi:hypothetical protein